MDFYFSRAFPRDLACLAVAALMCRDGRLGQLIRFWGSDFEFGGVSGFEGLGLRTRKPKQFVGFAVLWVSCFCGLEGAGCGVQHLQVRGVDRPECRLACRGHGVDGVRA